MMRPSRDESLMATAFIWAKRSTCSRLNVGCVIHRDGRILVTGYNGAPSGLPHCVHLPGDETPCTDAEHAERNAVAFAARHGVELGGAELVVTHQPCKPCSMSIINAGIISVTYDLPYRLQDGVHLLKEAGVRVRRFVTMDDAE